MWRLIVIFIVACSGFWLGKEKPKYPVIHLQKECQLVEYKPFVFIVYSYNQKLWCKRTLSSIFEQEYEHYRVIFVDDGSVDNTAEMVQQFVIDNHEEGKTILIHNESKQGKEACLRRAIAQCLDRELVIILDAKEWLAHPGVTPKLNSVFQNSEVAVASGQTIAYPTYALSQGQDVFAFYAEELKGLCAREAEIGDYKESLRERAKDHVTTIFEPFILRVIQGSGYGKEAP